MPAHRVIAAVALVVTGLCAAARANPPEELHNNGPLVTHPSSGFGGADVSAVQTSIGLTVFGFNNSLPMGFSVADDFDVTAPGGWQISQLVFFGYQDNTPPNPTIMQMVIRVWNGRPGDPSSQVVVGPIQAQVSNGTLQPQFANVYRAPESNLLANNRPVMRLHVLTNFMLPQGAYWLEWQAAGTMGPEVRVPPVTILGQQTTGNARQLNPTMGGWIDAVDGPFAQGLPFQIIGKDIPECDDPSDCDDGDPCTIDACIDGLCVHHPIDCDDGDPCTIDECINGECIHTPVDCDDGIDCTFDFCFGGDCYHIPFDADCDDGDPCTVDVCTLTGCMYTPLEDTLTREEALRMYHDTGLPCLGGGGGPPYGALPLLDVWRTSGACDGTTSYEIGLGPGDPVIPADFFEPGSEPWSGVIKFLGESLKIPQYGAADTIIKRSADPFSRSDPVSTTTVTVEIEIVQLNLVSCEPIVVIVDGEPTAWDVRANLSDCSPPAGTLTATKTHCNGGTYDNVLIVQARLTFTKVGAPTEVRVLDTGCVDPPFPYDSLEPPGLGAWVHDIRPGLVPAINYMSAFHPGLPEGQSTACGDYDLDNDADGDDLAILLQAYAHAHPDVRYNPSIDYNLNGVVDFDDFQEWMKCHRCSAGDPDAPVPPPGLLGDVNGDGAVNGDDSQHFIDCIITGTTPPPGDCVRADIDQNGTPDAGDIPGYVLLLMVL